MENGNALVEKYTPLVKMIAAQYKNSRVPFDDLVQEGLLGLLEATQRFDPQKGIKLSTYASHWIRKRMLEALKHEQKMSLNAVFLDPEVSEPLIEISPDAMRTDSQSTQSMPLPKDLPEIETKILRLAFEEHKTLKEIAQILNLPLEKTRQLKQKALRRLRLNPELTQALYAVNT
jgi:RNA polymerase sigma factor (sigma-70 family)